MRAPVGRAALIVSFAFLAVTGAVSAAPTTKAEQQQGPSAPSQSAPGSAAQARPQPPPKESCMTCHADTGDDRLANPVKAYTSDVHLAKGFGCSACHGGDPTAEGPESMDPKKGFIGVPNHQQTVQVCGRCHADPRFMKQYNPSLRVDQVAEYATSVHGRRLREQNDQKVATCASCHRAHSIKPRSDPSSSIHPTHVADTCGRCHADAKYMAEYKIPTDQLARYRQSIHWKTLSVKGDLSAPTCNSCHGNHGAAPPGVSWVGNVCGQCHTVMADLFAKSVHARAFEAMGTPGCATCHENHAIKEVSDDMLGVDAKAVCSGCHGAGDSAGKTAASVRQLIDRLRDDVDRSHTILTRAEHAGMEVSQPEFELNGATDALVKARAAIHAFTVEAVKKEVEPGLTISAKAYARGVRALEELRFRRVGLAVSALIIAVLVVALLLKIRHIDRKRTLEAREG
jgi:predicted CXXCH cytochrome family protein